MVSISAIVIVGYRDGPSMVCVSTTRPRGHHYLYMERPKHWLSWFILRRLNFKGNKGFDYLPMTFAVRGSIDDLKRSMKKKRHVYAKKIMYTL